MRDLLRELRFAVRGLRKSPGFTLIAVLTLGLGIGLNAAIFGMVDTLLWKAWPVQAPDRLALVHSRPRAEGPDAGWFDWSYPDYLDLRRGTAGVFEDMIAYEPLPLSLSVERANERVWGEIVSPNYFTVLGVQPAQGRGFVAEGQTGTGPEVVLSHATWQRRFGGDPGVVGRTLKLNGNTFTVAGVAPPPFHGIYYQWFRPALWVSASAYDLAVPGDAGALERRGATSFRLAGRLQPGATLADAAGVVAAVGRELERAHPTTNAGSDAVVLSPREARPEPSMSRVMTFAGTLFLALAGLVLLVACANVASLLLTRAAARRREVAVRLSLGATRAQLVRQLLAEALVLAAAGGAAGLALAWAANDVLGSVLRLPTDIPFAFETELDARGLAFAAAVTLGAAFAFGLAPAWSASRPNLVAALRGADALALRGRRFRAGDVLVVAQLSVASVLLLLAGLGVRSLAHVAEVDPGFDTRGRLLATVAPGLQGYDEERGAVFYRELLERAKGLPGVRSATLVQFVPLDFSGSGGSAFPEGFESRGGEPPSVSWAVIGPDYFETLGTPILEGRAFGDADEREGAQPVAVVSETLARRFWPGGTAIGRRLRLGSADAAPVEVVGVAADVKVRNLTEGPQPFLYLPLAQNYRSAATLVARVDGEPLALAPALRETLRELDSEMPLSDVKTLESLVRGRGLFTVRFAAGTVAALGALALLLAVVGLYGVVSYAVTRRFRDIGIRMALGAQRQRVLAEVLRSGLRLAAAGLVLGALGGLAVARGASSLLYGVQPADPLTLAAIAALLTGVALLASWVPAHRATRIDPLRVLRHE